MATAELFRRRRPSRVLDELRERARVLAEALMALEATRQLEAECHERTVPRSGLLNGYREPGWDTRVGTIALHVMPLRSVSKTGSSSLMTPLWQRLGAQVIRMWRSRVVSESNQG